MVGSNTQNIASVETTKETWCAADLHRMAGEIALLSSEPNAEKAQAHFEHALAIATEQQVKSFELRAATSMARLWGEQGRRAVYGWFTEGLDTLDLKEAKTLLDELAP